MTIIPSLTIVLLPNLTHKITNISLMSYIFNNDYINNILLLTLVQYSFKIPTSYSLIKTLPQDKNKLIDKNQPLKILLLLTTKCT